jgi:hypothetical protein
MASEGLLSRDATLGTAEGSGDLGSSYKEAGGDGGGVKLGIEGAGEWPSYSDRWCFAAANRDSEGGMIMSVFDKIQYLQTTREVCTK